ncbi:Eukaryotic/viral aspartic protease [Phytophthora cinnamomi]|uniref:Eukaryotic/viral aspartic protease n=1 Tax=Phytophthora cinnamomi TaxID=4785 RepID=UPI00355A65F8|nr:Eukaryotic/viral aspartic protease [Phytophthora cinnamomi]
MRTLVNGAVDDSRTRILLDTGANVSVISEKLAKRLKLREVVGHGRCMDVQGNTKGKMMTTRRAKVNVTLGWERVYVFEVWIMDHCAGVEVVLGTDFMIPAGSRRDLLNATAKLPDEVMIPLIKTQNMMDEAEGSLVVYGPTEPMQIPGHEWDEFKPQRRQPEPTTHVPWIRRTETFMPTVTRFYKGRPVRIRLTNATDRLASCPVHFPVIVWVPIGSLPKTEGYVRLDSAKYKEWQVLAYAAARDKTLLKWEAELYQQWLAKQPPAVERRQLDQDWRPLSRRYAATKTKDWNVFIAVMRVLATEGTVHRDDETTEHPAADIELEGYAHELAFLPDLSEPEPTTLNYSAANVKNPELSADQQGSLI